MAFIMSNMAAGLHGNNSKNLLVNDNHLTGGMNQFEAAWLPFKLLPQKLAEIQQRNLMLTQIVQQQAHDISTLASQLETAIPQIACLEQQWLVMQQQQQQKVVLSPPGLPQPTAMAMMDDDNNKDRSLLPVQEEEGKKDDTPSLRNKEVQNDDNKQEDKHDDKHDKKETGPNDNSIGNDNKTANGGEATKPAVVEIPAKTKNPASSSTNNNTNNKNKNKNKNQKNDNKNNKENQKNENNKNTKNNAPNKRNNTPNKNKKNRTPTSNMSTPTPIKKSNQKRKNDEVNAKRATSSPTSVALVPSNFPPPLSSPPPETPPTAAKQTQPWTAAKQFLLEMGYAQVDVEAARDAMCDLTNHQSDNGAYVDALITWIEERHQSNKTFCSDTSSITLSSAPSSVHGDPKPISVVTTTTPKRVRTKRKSKKPSPKTAGNSPTPEEEEIERISREAEERARQERLMERQKKDAEEEKRVEEQANAEKAQKEADSKQLLDFFESLLGECYDKQDTLRAFSEGGIFSLQDVWNRATIDADASANEWNQNGVDGDAFLAALAAACGKVYRPHRVTKGGATDGQRTESVAASAASTSPTKMHGMPKEGDSVAEKSSEPVPASNKPSGVPEDRGLLSRYLFPTPPSASKMPEREIVFEMLRDPQQVEQGRKLLKLEHKLGREKKELGTSHKEKGLLEGKITKLQKDIADSKLALKAKIEAIERPLLIAENEAKQLYPKKFYEGAVSQFTVFARHCFDKRSQEIIDAHERACKNNIQILEAVSEKANDTTNKVQTAKDESQVEQKRIQSEIEKIKEESNKLDKRIEIQKKLTAAIRRDLKQDKGVEEDPHFDINASRNLHGLSFLMIAAQNNDLDTAQLCIQLGASLDVKCPRGLTAFAYAKYLENPAMIKFLEDSGASATENCIDMEGRKLSSGAVRMSWETTLRIAERASVPVDSEMPLNVTGSFDLLKETDTEGIDTCCFDGSLSDPSACTFARVLLFDTYVWEWMKAASKAEMSSLLGVVQSLRSAHPVSYRSFVVGVKRQKQFAVRMTQIAVSDGTESSSDSHIVLFYTPFVSSYIEGVCNVGVLIWAVARANQDVNICKHRIVTAEFRRHKVDNPDDHFPPRRDYVLELGKDMHLLDLMGHSVAAGNVMTMTLFQVNVDEELDALKQPSYTPSLRMLHQEAKLRDALFKQESQEQTLLLPSAMQSTSLQGGAGTGKTLTLVKKLVSEAPDTSILVITRLPKLVAFMKSEAQQKRNIDNVAFATYEELIRDMTRSIQPSAIRETQSFPAFSRVGFATDTGVCFNEGFVNQFLEPLERKRMEKSLIMAEALWLHIRLIKSSALCATTNMPLTLDQYLSLPTQYGFNREQREVIFTLCKRYQEWLIQESLHDEADRVLYILSACSGGRSLSSSLRDSPFPFDMVMVDEAQDFTELDLSLFIRIASSVRSLFLGSDPAQSVEIGVRMRTGTINRVFNGALAPDGKHLQVKDVLQEISLSTNYRTHAKNVMLAKAIRRVLTRSFGVPGTTENAVMEGPIPRAMHIDSLDELANENTFRGADTVIICPDSVVDEMRTKLAALGVTNDVFGVRETKGLEFTNVLVFGFFMLSEDDCPREWMNALRWMGSTKKITATESSERVKGVALEPCDYSLSHPQLEDQASALYTAITRCKGQLYLCEAASGWGDSNGNKTSQKRKGQSLAQFALRHLADLGLVVQVNRIDAGEQVVTPQQHKVRGVQLVVQGIEMSKTSASTGAVRKKFLEAAERFSPEKGNDNHLAFQCMQHMEAITLMRSLRQYAKDKFFVKKKGRYELQGHFAEILQFEKDTCKLLRLAANDSFLWEVVQEHKMLVDEVFFGSPFQVHFCSRGYET